LIFIFNTNGPTGVGVQHQHFRLKVCPVSDTNPTLTRHWHMRLHSITSIFSNY